MPRGPTTTQAALLTAAAFAAFAGDVSADLQVDGAPGLAAEASGNARTEERARAERQERRRANEERFHNLSFARGGIATTGFALFVWGVWQHRRQRRERGKRRERGRRLRLAALVLLAALAFASYYNFFRLHHAAGFKSADVFHYYMGSKYFAEIGYFDLYECTLAALIEQGRHPKDEMPEVRDQRTLRLQRPERTRVRVAQCPERFAPERWRAFGRDVAFFRPRILGGSWTHLLVDHGYNPTPVWAFVGGLVSGSVPAEADAFPLLIQADRVLAVASFALVVWAFGLEVACLLAIAWGTSPLWSYNWIGDAFLRNLWLTSAVASLCLLRKGLPLASGAALALTSLLRVFPGIGVVGLALHALRGPRLSSDVRRFAAGAAAVGTLLLVLGAFGTGGGVGAYLDFGEKMSGLVAQASVNKIGLSAIAGDLVHRATTFTVDDPQGRAVRLERPAPFAVAAVRGAQIALVLAGLVAFWLSAGRLRDWEAVAASFALVPLLTSPANYYYPLVLVAGLLASSRPWVGVALAATCTAWIATAIGLFLDESRYTVYSVIAVAFALTVLVGLARSGGEPEEGVATQRRLGKT